VVSRCPTLRSETADPAMAGSFASVAGAVRSVLIEAAG